MLKRALSACGRFAVGLFIEIWEFWVFSFQDAVEERSRVRLLLIVGVCIGIVTGLVMWVVVGNGLVFYLFAGTIVVIPILNIVLSIMGTYSDSLDEEGS